MGDYSSETEGSATAAFALAQIAFWAQISAGGIPQDTAIAMLKATVAAHGPNEPGGNEKATRFLQTVLDMVERNQGPPAH